MNTKIYISALLLLATTATQYALIGDIVSDAVNTAGNVVDDAAYTAGNIANDAVYTADDVVDDAVYTPYVAADKTVRPIRSVSQPVKTTADILPISTYGEYRSDYYYN